MSFCYKAYLNKVHQLRPKFPDLMGEDLYEVHLGPDGQVQGLSPIQEYLPIPDGFGRIRRSETCRLKDNELDFPAFAFHLIPDSDSVLSIGIHKDSEAEETHANPDPKVESTYGGHRLYYPGDTSLNISSFCLLYFVVLVLTYRATGEYPLCKSGIEKCNMAINRFRKQVEL